MIKRISIFFLLAVFLASCGSLRRGSSKMDQSPIADKTENDGVEVRDDLQSSRDLEEEEPQIVVREEKVKSVEFEEKEQNIFRYYVIIGSFRVFENARNFKQDLSNQGFIPVILENEEGLFRVSVSAYDDEGPARKNIASIRRNHPGYDDVWLLIRKL